MAEGGLHRTWWQRLCGRLEPRPSPFADAATLESPLRRAFASPKRILGAFGLAPGERVLEVGPGIGYYSREARARVGASGRLVCFDVQHEMLRATRGKLGPDARAQLVQASALHFAVA